MKNTVSFSLSSYQNSLTLQEGQYCHSADSGLLHAICDLQHTTKSQLHYEPNEKTEVSFPEIIIAV